MEINCSIYISSLLLEYHKFSFYVVIIHSTFSIVTKPNRYIVYNILNNLVSLSRKLKIPIDLDVDTCVHSTE